LPDKRCLKKNPRFFQNEEATVQTNIVATEVGVRELGKQAQIATMGICASEVVFKEHRQTFL